MSRKLVFKFEISSQRKHCCSEMTVRANFTCPKCKDQLKCSDKDIFYSSIFDEYSIINQKQTDVDSIYFCPWCGKKLPPSRRDQWFEVMDKIGVDICKNWKEIPPKYLKYNWWK